MNISKEALKEMYIFASQLKHHNLNVDKARKVEALLSELMDESYTSSNVTIFFEN